MTQARHDKEAENVVEERNERKKDISKALGVILETIDDGFRIYRLATPEAQTAYDDNDIKSPTWIYFTTGCSYQRIRSQESQRYIRQCKAIEKPAYPRLQNNVRCPRKDI